LLAPVRGEMPQLKMVEETEDRLVFRMSAFYMLGQMSLCTCIVAAVAVSGTLFLRHYIGIFAFTFVALPGVIGVICGFFGCANSRAFVFTFDRTAGDFAATSGGAKLSRPLREVLLVYVERELNAGMMGDSQPSFALALLFTDSHRYRLEGGVSIAGHGHGPNWLHEQAEKIKQFLRLPQEGVPVLNLPRAARDDERLSDREKDVWLSRWLGCRGLAPKISPPLYEYEWVEPPRNVLLPPPPLRPAGQRPGAFGTTQTPMYAPDQRVAPIVVGRVYNPQPRTMQVQVPPGLAGGQMAAMSPDGVDVMLTVPDNMAAGGVLTVQY